MCALCSPPTSKNDGSARFVHKTRHVNKYIDPEKVKCNLETLLRTRNMYVPGDFMTGFDFSSGYHGLYMFEGHQKFLAFALLVSELKTRLGYEVVETELPKFVLPQEKVFRL